MILCEYGCGQEAKYQLKNGKHICSKGPASCPINKAKNSKGVTQAHIEGRIPGWNQIENLNRAWSKGLTKETDVRIKNFSDIKISKFKSGELKGTFSGRRHTQETKQKWPMLHLKEIMAHHI